jgi:signal transduction histidine kinase/CheY-like chemotaxis protein
VWFAAITMWATTRHLYITLSWAWENSTRADRNLEEARDYQGKLAAALRQIEEANYRLAQANHALDWARAEAENARQLKAQFAAHVSHELRTPINLVVGFAELMLNNPEAYSDIAIPPTYLPDLQALYRSAHHLQGLIDDILDLSQIDAHQMPLVKDLTEVNAIVQEAVATARPLLDRKGLSVVIELTPDLPMLNLDRLRIRQVLLNLLNNAARYTDAGGVTVRYFREGDDVVITVTDTGLGIRSDDLQRLFEEYHQLEPSVTRGRGGTGLGLAITRRFVELHHGRVWATSPGPGKGSTFGITLPIHADDLGVLPVPAGGASRRVLTAAQTEPSVIVLDDDPSVVALFHRYLEGYQVVGAASEDDAVRLARRLGAHALVVDLAEADHLVDWHRCWLDVSRRQNLRIVGCPMPSGRRLARTLGLADYLVKPVSRDVLLATIHAVAPSARMICVVDDQPQMVNLLCRMLRSDSRHYQLVRAYNGTEGLEIIRRCQPDLVLLDVLMPEVDGLTVIERMRDEPALATIPVIAVSARGAVEGIAPSTTRVMSVVHDGPLSVGRLLRTVQTTLDNLPPARLLTEQSGEASAAEPGGSAVF